MKVRFIPASDTRENWLAKNPVALPGEICVEIDTGRWKFGDGRRPYSELPYAKQDFTQEFFEMRKLAAEMQGAENNRQSTFETNEDERQNTFEINESVRHQHAEERYGQLEEEYAPKLTEVTAQLAHTDKRIDEIITTPADGITEQEIIDARLSQPSLGAKMRQFDEALSGNYTEKIASDSGEITVPENSKYTLSDLKIEGNYSKETGLEFLNVEGFLSSGIETLYTNPVNLKAIPGMKEGGTNWPSKSDSLDKKGLVTRKIGSIIVDGSTNVIKSNTQFDGVGRFVVQNLSADGDTTPSGFVKGALSDGWEYTAFVSSNVPSSFRMYDSIGGSVLFIFDTEKTGISQNSTIQEVVGYLQSNPVTIHYQLHPDHYIEENAENVNPRILPNEKISVKSNITPLLFEIEFPVIREILKLPVDDIMLKSEFNTSEFNTSEFKAYYELPEIIEAPRPAPSHQEIYVLYDELVSNKTRYNVEMTVLGTDGQGNQVRSYKFSRPTMINDYGFERTKVGIMSGLHGNERYSVYALYQFMKDLSENEHNNEVFDRIMTNVDFYIIPIGCPTGWDNGTRENWNGVNLNRNFDAHWETTSDEDKGSSPASEEETQIIQSWMIENNLDYFTDFHVANMGIHEGAYTASWFNTDYEDDVSAKNYYRTLNVVTNLYSKKYDELPNDLIYGHIKKVGNLSQSHRFAIANGITGSLLEISEYLKWFEGDIYKVGINWSAEMIGNFMIELTRKHLY